MHQRKMKKQKRIKKVLGLKLPSLTKCQSVQLHFTPQPKRQSNRILSVPDLLKNKPEVEDVSHTLFTQKLQNNSLRQDLATLKTKNL